MDILKHLDYCPPNVTIRDIWVNNGLSHCFFDTVSSSVIAAFIVISGSIQLAIYRKYATPVNDRSSIPSPKLYYLQLLLLSLLPSLSVLRFILESFVFPDAHLYGYTVIYYIFFLHCHSLVTYRLIHSIEFQLQIVASSLTVISFLFSICLVIKERYYLLPSAPTRGHGLVLLLFWTLVFINENFSIMNLNKEDWWNHVFDHIRDKIEMTLFVTRYVCTLLIFVLGLKAPGLRHYQGDDYVPMDNENENQNNSVDRKI